MADASPLKIVVEDMEGEVGVFTLNEHLNLVIPDEAGDAYLTDNDIDITDLRQPQMPLTYADGRRFMGGLMLRFSGVYVRARIVQEDEPLALQPVPLALAGNPDDE